MIRPANTMPKRPNPLIIDYFLGTDVTGTDDIRRSPDMINCVLDDEGTPEMRTGYDVQVYLGVGPILGIHRWSAGLVILHHGTKLYTYDMENAPVEISSAMDGTAKSRSFMLGTKLVIFDGSIMMIYDGLVALSATSLAYTPYYLIGGDAAGGGTRNEDLNLLSPRWWHQYSTVAGTLTYLSHETDLDAVELVILNGVELVLTTDYTIDLTAGSVTLTSDPGNTTNGLEIKFRKDSLMDSDRITKCTFSKVFGGANDSRVFMSGNPDYPHIDWWTGLPLNGSYDPTYWPDTNYDRIGGDNEAVRGYAVQYDRMLVMKEESIFLRSASIETDAYGRTVTRFPSYPLNDKNGCYSADSVQLIENNPYFLDTLGMRELVSSQIRDERNVEDISTLAGIEASGDGVAIDFRDKYHIAVGDNRVWVADYKRQVQDEANRQYKPIWYEWTDLPVNCWYSDGTHLYFGSNEDGTVYMIKNKDDAFPYNDNGAAIDTRWSTIFTTFDRDDLTKLVQSAIIRQKKWSRAEINVEYATEEGASGVVHTERVVLIDFADIDFSDFSFDTSRLPLGFKVRIDDARNIQTFRLTLTSSGVANEFFGFASISIVYQNLSEVR